MHRSVWLSCVEALDEAILVGAQDGVLIEAMPLGLLKVTSDGYLDFVLLIVGVNDVSEPVLTRCQQLVGIHGVPLHCLHLVLMMVQGQATSLVLQVPNLDCLVSRA